MRPIHHTIASGIASAVFGFFTRSVPGAAVCFLSGIFIDLDHFIDFWIAKKKLFFSYKELDFYFTFDRGGKIHLFFHSFELAAMLWAVSMFFPSNSVLWGLTVGVVIHILLDYFYNPLRPFAYFFFYRLKNKFSKEALLEEGYFRNIWKTVMCTAAAVMVWSLSCVHAFAQEQVPYFTGEQIVYGIKKMGIKAGEANLTFTGPTDLEGRKVYLIIFRAEGFNFYDEEKIYVTTDQFWPVRVERDLNIFGSKEKITEFYDTQSGQVRVVKQAGGKKSEQVLKKEGRIDNIYCFIYRYRLNGEFKIGESFTMNLPTTDIQIKLVEETRLEVTGTLYNAFYMQSDPPKYRLWFDQSNEKIPLRIDGAVGFGKTAMIMQERGWVPE